MESAVNLTPSKAMRLLLALLIVLLQSCDTEVLPAAPETSAAPAATANRWYSSAQLDRGAQVFAANCALCHGQKAEGTVVNWRARLDDGSFPPPPLNGSAHAWHHPLEILIRVIDYGGAALGGKMPAFDDVLEQPDKLAAVAYFQGFWSDEIYQQWMQMGGNN